MNFFIKYKKEILIGLVLIILFFASRLINLTALPIFTDEAIYLRWAQIAKNDANWRFISLTDGKQPLYVWLAMIAMKVISDPLVAGRVVSVFCGLLGMFFIGLLTWEIFKSKKAAFLASLLYLVYPSALFYDRMALMDGLLAVMTIVTLYLEILLVKKIRLDLALLTGMAMGATMLVKTSGFFTLYLAPLLILFFDFSQKKWMGKFSKLVLLGTISAVLSQVYYSVLRLSPFFHMVGEKDTTFVYPFAEWLSHPLTFFVGNFQGMIGWTVLYLTWPITIAIVLALVFALKKFTRERLFLFLWFLGPFTALALFGKVLYPRFILFMTMPLLVLASSSFIEIENFLYRHCESLDCARDKLGARQSSSWLRLPRRSFHSLLAMTLFILVLPSLLFNYKFLFDITHAPLTAIDKGQYVNDWPSGWGVNEANTYLAGEAKKGKIAIFTDGTFGLMPYAIELYLVYNKNVTIKGLWPLNDIFPKEIADSVKKVPTFFIADQKEDISASWPLVLLGKWQKGINPNASLRLYKVIPQGNIAKN